MRPAAIFRSTRSFAWAKFGLCFLMLVCATGLFCVMVGLSMLASPVLGWFMFALWLCLCIPCGYLFYTRILYLTEAGHIAAMTDRMTAGHLSSDMLFEKKQKAKYRFRTHTNYFQLKRIMFRSIRQLQAYFETVSDDAASVPGMQTLLTIGKFLEHLALSYISCGCLGYVLWCSDLSVYVAAREGVAIYAYNWNRLTEKSGETAAAIVAVTLLSLTGGIFGMNALCDDIGLGNYAYFGMIFGAILVLSLKYAFFDSYLTVRALKNLLDHAQNTVLSDALYEKLSEVSPSFGKLYSVSLAHPKPTRTTIKKNNENPAMAHGNKAIHREHLSRQTQQQNRTISHSAPPIRKWKCPVCGNINPAQADVCIGCESERQGRS